MVDYNDYPELIRAIKNTEYVENRHIVGSDLHPHRTPRDYAAPLDESQAVRLFSELVRNITDNDYGDFMRRANGYLVDLKSRIGNMNGAVRKKLQDMQFYTQFIPNGDVESTRARLLRNAQILERWIKNSKLVQAGEKVRIERRARPVHGRKATRPRRSGTGSRLDSDEFSQRYLHVRDNSDVAERAKARPKDGKQSSGFWQGRSNAVGRICVNRIQ